MNLLSFIYFYFAQTIINHGPEMKTNINFKFFFRCSVVMEFATSKISKSVISNVLPTWLTLQSNDRDIMLYKIFDAY